MSSSDDLADDSIPVITGPTAAGKSAVALWLASHGKPLTIISADSRQVYRGFDAGTAKPSLAERDQVPHECIDIADPTAGFSAFAWAELASRAIDAARQGGRQPLVVGGTGLYLRTLFDVSFAEPEHDESRRSGVREALRLVSTPELRRWCERLDPPRASLGRAQLLRSVEIALLTGQRLSDLHTTSRRTPRWRARYLVVDPGAGLGARIAERAQAMLSGPWQAEVRELLHRVPPDAPAWKSTGYAAVRAAVEGRMSHAAALDRVVIETRQYAKRQRTWFRHQLPSASVLRVDPTAPAFEEQIARWWDEREEAMQA